MKGDKLRIGWYIVLEITITINILFIYLQNFEYIIYWGSIVGPTYAPDLSSGQDQVHITVKKTFKLLTIKLFTSHGEYF